MRNILFILLLSPCLAFANTYKCVVKGQTVYSGEPCGADAQAVDTRLAGIQDAPQSAVPTIAQNRANAAANASKSAAANNAAPAANAAPSKASASANSDCKTRIAQYQESAACFARYRINANAMDPEAANHCTEVPFPSDCENAQ